MSRALAMRETRSPSLLGEVDEAKALAVMSGWAKSARLDFDGEASREWVDRMLRHALRTGLVNVIDVIAWAEKQGDFMADAALRAVGAEIMRRRPANAGEEQIVSYLQRVAHVAPLSRGRGRAWTDNWRRDFIICATIEILRRELGLRPTRNRASQRADAYPCGCSMVAKLWPSLEEANAQKIWSGLTGRLVREAFAQGAGVFLYPNETGV
jgi:hypothetical protein